MEKQTTSATGPGRALPCFAMGWLLAALSLGLSACSDADTAAKSSGSFRITVSGESLALNGYAFPPLAGQEVFFADGWELEFDRAMVVIDRVQLSERPDLAPGDQSRTGDVVAELGGGPWAVDVASAGAGSVAGKENGSRAWPLGEISERSDGSPFDAAERYALGYAFASADKAVSLLGIDAEDPLWGTMVQQGYSHYFVGVARRKADVLKCSTTGEYDFSQLPKEVRFELGFHLPVASLNCQNPELTGKPFEGEESQRGVQPRGGQRTDVQLTIHTDHLFWNTTLHDATPLFNHWAARAVERQSRAVVTMQELEGAPLSPVVDQQGKALGWMSCEASWQVPTTPSTFSMDPGSLSLQDMAALISFNASTLGHLNQDGLCYVKGAASE